MKMCIALTILNLLAWRAAAFTATNLSSFEGIEAPVLQYHVANNSFTPGASGNITDQGDHTVRMFLHYRANAGWDADRDRHDTTRQRAEVKGLGPHQKTGDTFEYATTWRTDPAFRGSSRFCHVFQLKATDGDNGAPLVTLSILNGTNQACVHYWSGGSKGFITVRKFAWSAGVWENVRIRITTAIKPEGAISVSVNGDAFQGVKGVPVYRPDATDYRPKWGLYRGTAKDMPFGDDYVEHKDASARKM